MSSRTTPSGAAPIAGHPSETRMSQPDRPPPLPDAGRMAVLQLLSWSQRVPEGTGSADRDRLAFYRAAHQAVAASGLYNPYEVCASSIEVPNALRATDLPEAIVETGVRPGLASQLVEAGFTVLDPSLYPPSASHPGFFAQLSGGRLSDADLLLLDPYYGLVVLLDEDRPQHLYLVHERWDAIRRRFPPNAESTSPSDALWQGSDFGKLLFGEHLGPAARQAYADGLVAEVTVRNSHEYHVLTNKLVKWARKAPKVGLWFRGQQKEYRLTGREHLVAEGLAPRWSATDASIVPSLYREIDARSQEPEGYRQLVLEVGDWLSRAEEVLPPSFTVRSPLGEAAEPFPDVPDIGWSTHWTVGEGEDRQEFVKDWHLGGAQLQRGLVLQHYGFPTPWIDITSDPDVALFFAMHRCESDGGTLSFERHTWDGEDAADWPTVFVFALVADSHPMIDSGALLRGSSSLRPQRQRCGLLGAAGNVARNYPARYLALRIRLRPPFEYQSLLTADYLFPGPELDSTLERLLAVSRPATFPGLFPVTRVET